jgi:Ca-activated chloride channel family protein
LKILVSILFLFSILNFNAQELTRILFILDASNSMNAKWTMDQTRIQAAKELLAKEIDGLVGTPNLEVALRVYGHQSPITATFQDCNDTKLEVPFAPDNYQAIKNRIKSIQAKGTTPIARSLEAAAEDFPDRESRNIIILITDGVEACDNDPCVIAQKLKDKGIKVTPFVIGLGMDLSYLDKFNCIGTYSDAETKDAFKSVLSAVVSKALVNTTAQINLNNTSGQPLETDVTMFLYEAGTKNLKYTFTHTLNRFGLPDTLVIDPKLKYDLVVNTLPKVEKNNIAIKRNIHNVIEVDAPQGFINVRFINASRLYPVKTRVMKLDSEATINVQEMSVSDKYIVGKYKLEILTLPRIYKTIEVTQSSTVNVNIDAPGKFSYKLSALISGQVFIKNEDGSFDWVCNIDPNSKSGLWELQPGSYILIYRQQQLKSAANTMQTEFRINSNKTTSINL